MSELFLVPFGKSERIYVGWSRYAGAVMQQLSKCREVVEKLRWKTSRVTL
jgi:hypothetical protein